MTCRPSLRPPLLRPVAAPSGDMKPLSPSLRPIRETPPPPPPIRETPPPPGQDPSWSARRPRSRDTPPGHTPCSRYTVNNVRYGPFAAKMRKNTAKNVVDSAKVVLSSKFSRNYGIWRECWSSRKKARFFVLFIEGQAFLWSYDSAPHPLLPASCLSFSVSVCCCSTSLAGEGGVGVGVEPNHMIATKPGLL